MFISNLLQCLLFVRKSGVLHFADINESSTVPLAEALQRAIAQSATTNTAETEHQQTRRLAATNEIVMERNGLCSILEVRICD